MSRSLAPEIADEYFNRALSDDCLPIPGLPVDTMTLDKSVLDERCLTHDRLLPVIPDGNYPCPHFQTLLGRLRSQLIKLSKPHYVLSLSGGVDSMTHLMLLNVLRKELGFGLSACHIRHSSRPDEAEKEEQWARWVAGLVGVEVFSHYVEVWRPHGEVKSAVSRDDFEELARKVRFNMYRKAYKISCPLDQIDSNHDDHANIIIGHHMDDVDENRLAELGKQTLVDINGMGMIETMEGCRVLRPLCEDTRKDELIEAAQSLQLPYMHNSTPLWSKRGWIRAVIDEEISDKNHLLELLENAGNLSAKIACVLQSEISSWKSQGLQSFQIPCKNKTSEITISGFKMRVGDLLSTTVPKIKEEISRFSKLVEEIAAIWNPSFKKRAAKFPAQTCPIQPVRPVEAERIEALILGETLVMNFGQLKSVLKGQMPGRTPLKNFCDVALTSNRPVMGIMLHKLCPVYFVKEEISIYFVENQSELLEMCQGKTEIAAAAILRSIKS